MPSSNHISVPSASPASTRIAAHVQQIHLLKTERATLTARLKRLEAHFNIIATNRKVVMGENTDLKAKTQSMQVEIDTLRKEKVAWGAEKAGLEKKVQESGQGTITVRSDIGSRGFLRPTLSSSGKKVDVFGDGGVSAGRAAGVKGRASIAGGSQVGLVSLRVFPIHLKEALR